MPERVHDDLVSHIALSEGRHPYPVMRPGFKPGWGRQPLPGRFDSGCFPPQGFQRFCVPEIRRILVPQNSLRGLRFIAASIAHL